MRVACVGDVMLDVIVRAEHPLAVDDDTEASITFAAGGQAANVATWVVDLGGEAVVFGPHGPAAGELAVTALRGRGVEVVGPAVERSGAVVSLVADGQRSMASDGGDRSWLSEVAPGPWCDAIDWLFVSGYALLRSRRPELLADLAEHVRAAGAGVAVDLSSAAMIAAYGPQRFTRLWRSLHPAVVFANHDEWGIAAGCFEGVLVHKNGANGAEFDGIRHRPDPDAPVIDVTGAGDALAAGYLVGGPELGMHAAARCVAQVGAQPTGQADGPARGTDGQSAP
ncbi:MAG: carbohydrate kinase family protein [Nocardioidaceae bacterium]